jgi:UDP-glucose 4-epimerase
MSGKRVLITGGRGYAGGRLTEALESVGYEVVLHTKGDGYTADKEVITADVTDYAAVLHAFQAAAKRGQIDAVIHLAAVNEIVCAKDPKLAFAVNCFGTQHVIDAAAAIGVRRFIYLSTFHVYGDVETATITEETVPNPLHPYGITHLVAELLCKATAKRTGMELAIIRLSNGVGAPTQANIDRWTLIMLDLCRQAHERDSMTLHTSGYQLRDFVSLDDLGQAVGILLTVDAAKLKDPVFNVGAGESVTVRELARIIQAEYEKLYHRVLPLNIADDGGKPGGRLEFKIDRMRALGYEPATDLAREARETLRFCERFKVRR